jgi:hypothetical protein
MLLRGSLYVLFCLTAGAAQGLPQGAAPTLTLDRTFQDFGRISNRAPVSCVFTLMNTGGAPLVLKDLATSCGCTTALPEKRVIAPGEAVELAVRYDPVKDIGVVRREIQVDSNDPAQPRATLNIQAEVQPPVFLDRRTLFFQNVLPREAPTESVHCLGFAGKAVALTGLKEPLPPHLSLKTAQEGAGVRCDLGFRPDRVPAGHRQGQDTVVLRTADRDLPEVTLSVWWSLGDAVLAEPARLAFPVAPAGSRLELPLRLEHIRRRPFRVVGGRLEDVRGGAPGFALEALPAGAASAQTVRVAVPAGGAPGLHTATLVLSLDDPDQAELRVELTALVQ